MLQYAKTNWQNEPNTQTPISAENLNHMDQGIYDAHQGLVELQGLAYGPLVASTVADMTDQTRVYVYTGSEAGYVEGDWYYYDGSAWVSGGVYNAVAVSTDKTLSISDKSADAKVTGDTVSKINNAIISAMTPRASSTESGLYTIQSGSITSEGRVADNNQRARSMYINVYNNARVRMTNSDYVIFRLWTYKQALDTGDSPQRQVVTDTTNGQSEVFLTAQGSEAYFRVVFCYASDHSRVLTSTDFDAISQAFVVEKGTDATFTKRDIAADSKAVGDNALVNRGTVASGLLEDCRTRGFYNINSTYVPTDAPSNGTGKMLVISPTDGSWTGISQIYFASDNSFWFRWNAAATKQDTFVWHRVTDCDNIINLINEMTKYQIDTSTITYTFGGITSEGQGKRTKTRIRMLKDGKGAFKAGSGSTIEAKPGYKFSVAVYDWYYSNSDFELRSYKVMNADPFTLDADGYIRIAIGTTSDDILWDEYETGVQYFTPAGIAAQDGLTLNITDKTVKEELAELENHNSNAFENVFLLEDEIPLNAVAFHELFDDFVTDGKISRTLIGNIGNDVTLPVYLYTLRSDMKHIAPNYSIIDWDGSNELYSRPKIFISSGVHGNERSTPFALYSFIADMINDVSLVDIRNAFDWYFVPLVNPWGFGHSAIIKATGNVSDGIGYTDQTISNYTVIDNTPQIHQGIRRNEAGIDANRDFDAFETEEAQLVRDALDSVYSDNRKCVFAMDMHQASVGDDVNIIGAFLSLNYGASSEQKDFAYGKWMQAGAKTEKLMADYCDAEEKQSVYAWDGTNLMTLRNYLANYSELASCFEGGQNVVYYSRDTTWSNSIARAFTNTQLHMFMQKITEKWMGIEEGAEVNVQSDWEQADNTAADYIKNKPDLSIYAEKDELWSNATLSGNSVTLKTQTAQVAQQTILTMLPIQSGSGTPAPDNVRPISGRTQAVIKTFGRNMLPKDTITSGSNNGITYTVNSDGTISLSNTAATDVSRASGTFSLNKGRYIFTSGVAETFSTYDTYLLVGGNTTIASGGIGQNNEFELTEPTTITFTIRVRQGVTPNITMYPMIRSAEDADATFTPYITPQTVTIPFGQTVYGGTLNVETGELTVEYMCKEFDGTEDIAVVGTGANMFFRFVSDVNFRSVSSNKYGCSHFENNEIITSNTLLGCYAYYSSNQQQSYIQFRVNIEGVTNATTFKAWLATQYNNNSPVQVFSKLATPSTATLTPQQIALIKGINNVSTDADGISLTYFADGESLTDADNRITAVLGDLAPVEGARASQNYSAGDYLIFSDKFCKASAAIASGEVLAIGTNLTQTTVGAELKAIIAQL